MHMMLLFSVTPKCLPSCATLWYSYLCIRGPDAPSSHHPNRAGSALASMFLPLCFASNIRKDDDEVQSLNI